ncbi:unnamed protein product [Pleuronectes platessa]|uniref:Uncharacterized protein n=1 Tax=Pleuronectes platessa TaxID=8262 RepID=A0A9N7Z3X2_PLEPL|nr:unnamed protein product [Pleuronectes platessa]
METGDLRRIRRGMSSVSVGVTVQSAAARRAKPEFVSERRGPVFWTKLREKFVNFNCAILCPRDKSRGDRSQNQRRGDGETVGTTQDVSDPTTNENTTSEEGNYQRLK